MISAKLVFFAVDKKTGPQLTKSRGPVTGVAEIKQLA
jgi:hypothetical protein